MSKFVCTCPGCNANFEVVADGGGNTVSCPACSCEVEVDKSKKAEVDEASGCDGCPGCDGC